MDVTDKVVLLNTTNLAFDVLLAIGRKRTSYLLTLLGIYARLVAHVNIPPLEIQVRRAEALALLERYPPPR